MKKIFSLALMVILLASLATAFAPSEPNPDVSCQENLAQCQADIQKLLAINQNLTHQLENITSQRDYYRTLYEQTLLDNFSVQKLESFESKIINNNYQYNTTVTEIKQTINNIKIRQNIIIFALVFEIGLFSFTFFKQRLLLKKTEQLLLKVNAVSIKTEKKNEDE
ncbi:hypothetical protein HYX10_04660 [Candidatus Woesearchaeota archaeon]|nr:hypothetical protein [Candidatus Woesearchaeota archaeon]